MGLVIGLTGTIGSGKGTVVDYLVKEQGFIHYSVRNYLTEIIKKKGLPVNRDSMVSVANDLRAKYSPSYLAEQLFERAFNQDKPAIIESLRTPGEIEALRNKGNFYLIAVDADVRIRYERISNRNSSTDNVGFQEFVENEQREMTTTDPAKQNLSKCIELADFRIDNSGSLKELNSQISIIFSLIKESADKSFEGFKRTDNISWDDYFMGVAMLSAMRSKDPNSQVGACIVNDLNKIVSTGYNGWPRGIDNDALPWGREGSTLEKKYVYVVHAEANAIANTTVSLNSCRLYVSLHPCNECAKLIIQSGIKEVIFISDKYANLDEYVASKRLLQLAGVKVRKFIPSQEKLIIDFDRINK